jgi:hypothetical protein
MIADSVRAYSGPLLRLTDIRMLETLSVQETLDIGATCFGRDLSAQPLSLGDRSLDSNTLEMIHYGNGECDPDGDRKTY